MVLILGGAGAGKKEYARSLGFTDADFSTDVSDGKPVLYDLETIVRDVDVPFDALLKKKLILCREVGSGVIPLDRSEREWREAVGRLCCALAKEATAVVRVVCGIPTVLKGKLPCISD
ncbi:MAG: bifunctional adenosylcobinamide kinase/adenosylcobinamide-phosphate guanylyltransferase [Clostridia bacterium]|nr:bifunctional adenosylcobinamide kinase/adenosylcobinamide-phosphate guanylyltransferase [Clostridia bacterium]